MKIVCHCGSTIYDGPEGNPNKAHLTPDQGWCAMWDTLDNAFDGVATGLLSPDAASMRARQAFSDAGSRLMWQCTSCGSLYLDSRDGTLQRFAPSTPETDNTLLRKSSAG